MTKGFRRCLTPTKTAKRPYSMPEKRKEKRYHAVAELREGNGREGRVIVASAEECLEGAGS